MSIQEQIKEIVEQNHIVLFMKGTPDFPQCGFSGKTAAILQSMDVEFGSVDVLESEAVRQGIKEYTNWPTIPQLYVNGEFVGGCDIISELHENGELESLLKQEA